MTTVGSDTTITTKRPRRPKRLRTGEALERAVTLAPEEVFQLFGIPPSTLCELATDADKARRLPSIKIGAWGGRKGVRLYARADLDAWIAWQRSGTEQSFVEWRTKNSPQCKPS